MLREQTRRAELQREHERPLLALARDVARLFVQEKAHFIAMRPDGRLPQPPIVLACRVERGGKILAASRLVFESELFARSADRVRESERRSVDDELDGLSLHD